MFVVFGKIWVVAEDMMKGLELADGKVTIVDKYFGFAALAKDVRKSVFPLQEVRVLIVCNGRAETCARDRDMMSEAINLMEAVREMRPAVVIYFSGPIPRSSDDPRRVHKLHGLGMQLKALLYDRKGAHYLSVAESLLTLSGLIQHLWRDRCLSEAALKMVAKKMEEVVNIYGPPPLQDLKVTVDF